MRARPLIRTLVLAGTLIATTVAVPSADAQSKRDGIVYVVFADYSKDGVIDPCKHSTEDLKLALGSITPDIRQYASDFPGAIKDAIDARARGACADGGGGGGEEAAVPAAAPPPAPTAATPAVPIPAGAQTETVVPDPPSPGEAGSGAATPGSPEGEAALERAAAAGPANDAPAPLIGLAGLGAVLLLTGLMLMAMKRLGMDEGRLAPAYASWREAGWRAGGVWEDFRDWLRLGR